MKRLSEFKTKTIVTIGLGAALFTLLFIHMKIPTGIPEAGIQTACGIGAFSGALFGPIAGGLIAFIEHALSGSIQYGSAWWGWVIASGTGCFLIGLVYPKLHVEDGELSGKGMIMFNVCQIIVDAIAWIVMVPVLGIVIYVEPMNLVFTQDIVAAVGNAVSASVTGTVLLILYGKTRPRKGGLFEE